MDFKNLSNVFLLTVMTVSLHACIVIYRTWNSKEAYHFLKKINYQIASNHIVVWIFTIYMYQ